MAIELHNVNISRKGIELVNEALSTGWISAGKMALKFENELSQCLGLKNPVTVNSGTSALHLALALSEVGPGDEVILPPQTFIATGLAILMLGAKPVFADIDPNTGNISSASIGKMITEKTKAIMPVHWSGYPCDLDEINGLAEKHGISVVEDAAHALGATYKGRPVGSISRFTAFSFQAIKHLTTGDGGAVCCRDNSDVSSARARRWFGIDREKSKPSILGEREYDINKVGYKYHLNDIGAALGLGNLLEFPENLKRRREIASIYRKELLNVPGLTLLEYKNDRESACWLFTIMVERREDFIKNLKAQDVPASVIHLRIDHNSVFGGITPDLPGQERFNEQQIAIPIHNALTDADVDLIIKSVKSGW